LFFIKCCYAPAGNFDIISDKHIISLLRKGPKYRLPSLVDFDACQVKVEEALETFSTKWCKREHVESNALSGWKKRVFDIIEKRVAFYSFNEHLLPPRPRNTFRHLKKGIQDFHSKYVFRHCL